MNDIYSYWSHVNNLLSIKLPTDEGSRISTIDTGATISSINKKFTSKIDTTEKILVKGIGGTEPSLGVTYMEIVFPGLTIRQKLHVLQDSCPMPNGLILGMDFLNAAQVVIDIPERKLRLAIGDGYSIDMLQDAQGENEVNFCTGISAPKLTIPARTQVRCKIPLKTKNEEVIVLPQTLPNGIFLAGSWSVVKDGMVDVALMNTGTEDVFISEMFPITRDATDYQAVSEMTETKSAANRDRWRVLKELLNTKGLSKKEVDLVHTLCKCFADVFHLPGDTLSTTDVKKQSIHLKPGTTPQYVKPFRNPFHQKQLVLDHIKKMEEDDIIEPSVSAWNAPLLIVPKKGVDSEGKRQYRVVIDYRKLNTTTQLDRYPLPNIHELIDQLGSARVFTCIDLSQGYYQVELDEDSRPCTAFITPDGKHYQMKRLPMGLNISPSAFSRIMALALAGLTGLNCLVYLDDLIIFSRDRQQHFKDLTSVFTRLRKVNLKVHPRKSHFFQQMVLFLGFKISKDGVQVDPEKCEKVRNWPQPKNKKELQSFLGLANFYRHFVRNFAEVSQPLTQLLKKRVEFHWNSICQEAFDAIKKSLCSTDVLAFPDFAREFMVHTDASKHSLGAVLSNANTRPVHFASRTMKPAELNYSTIEKELLAVVFALKTFRPYLLGKHFTLNTDHAPLVWLFGMNNPASRLTKFRLELEQFHFTVIHVPGKDNVVADALSRITSEDLKEMHKQVEKEAEQYAIFVLTRAQSSLAKVSPQVLELPRVPKDAIVVKFRKPTPKGRKVELTTKHLIVDEGFDEREVECELRRMKKQLDKETDGACG